MCAWLIYLCYKYQRYECIWFVVCICVCSALMIFWWCSSHVYVLVVSNIYEWVGGNMSLTSTLLRSKFLKFAVKYIKLIASLRILYSAQWLNNCSYYWHGFGNRFMSVSCVKVIDFKITHLRHLDIIYLSIINCVLMCTCSACRTGVVVWKWWLYFENFEV